MRERSESIRSFIHLLPAAVVFLVAIVAAHTSAQTPHSFDPNDEKACVGAIGPFPKDNSDPSGKSYLIDCAKADMAAEKTELNRIRRAEAEKSKAENAAFTALLTAFETYKPLQLELTVKGCGVGNGCEAYAFEEEAQTNYEFLNILKGFNGSGFPSYSANDLVEADTTLNVRYQEALRSSAKEPCPYGDEEKELCVPQIEIRTMERAWIRYRDAWAAFSAVKWPQVSAGSLRAYLTLQKIRTGWGGAVF
jgi:uncharacterized protein YecT (DUF1311 family)